MVARDEKWHLCRQSLLVVVSVGDLVVVGFLVVQDLVVAGILVVQALVVVVEVLVAGLLVVLVAPGFFPGGHA